MYDYHIHSSFSTDCSTSIETMVKKSIEIGLKEICFTDHMDYDYQDASIAFEFDIHQYTKEIQEIAEKYKNKIKIVKGIEIGIQPHLISQYDTLIHNGNFDFVISSIHTVDKKDIHIGDFFQHQTAYKSYEKYYLELLKCAKTFENFNVIGHMDLLRRYTHHIETLDTKNFFDIIEEIFKTIIYKGKGIEVNTSGFKYNLQDTMPSKDVLKFYHSLGGEIITTGSDAHTPEYLACKFDSIYALLKEIGFQYITTFKNQKPHFIKL